MQDQDDFDVRAPAAQAARIRVFFRSKAQGLPQIVERRLRARLRDAALSVVVEKGWVLVMADPHDVQPPEWTAIIGWLLRQEEVAFAVRVHPLKPHLRRPA